MKAIERLLRPFLIAVVVLMFIEVVVEVASRFIFHYSIPWGAEVSQTLLVWMTFIGSAVALMRNDHISIDFLLERLPFRARTAMLRVNFVIILVFLACGFWSGVQVVKRTWNGSTAALQIPAGILYLALPVGFALMIPFALRVIFTGKNKIEEEPLP